MAVELNVSGFAYAGNDGVVKIVSIHKIMEGDKISRIGEKSV